jgi:hypothetical protein
MLSECIEGACKPSLERGEILYEGTYWRNLKNSEVKQRYSDDSRPPIYGYRLRLERWNGWGNSPYELSVNACSCTSAICSILLHPTPGLFCHVAAIDVDELSKILGIAIVASYDPIEPSEGDAICRTSNPCHFNLLPLDQDIDIFTSLLRSATWYGFPSEQLKCPRLPHECSEALKAKESLEKAICVHYNIVT